MLVFSLKCIFGLFRCWQINWNIPVIGFIFSKKLQTEVLQLYQNKYQQEFSLPSILKDFRSDLLLALKFSLPIKFS